MEKNNNRLHIPIAIAVVIIGVIIALISTVRNSDVSASIDRGNQTNNRVDKLEAKIDIIQGDVFEVKGDVKEIKSALNIGQKSYGKQ